jgi:hypothetical protein
LIPRMAGDARSRMTKADSIVLTGGTLYRLRFPPRRCFAACTIFKGSCSTLPSILSATRPHAYMNALTRLGRAGRNAGRSGSRRGL